MCSVMAQIASSLDFRGGEGGLEAEHVEILRSGCTFAEST